MDGINVLLAVVTGILAALLTGGLKKLDTKITAKLGNLTPILVTVFSILLPLAGKALHIVDMPDAAAFVNSPLAVSVSIFARELAVSIKARYGPGGD